MIIQDIKKKLFQILTDLEFNVSDNNDNDTFPFVKMSLSNLTRERYKNSNCAYTLKYKLDIFSDYDGEAEILEMEQKIYDAIMALYEMDEIVNVTHTDVKIIDDKDTKVVRKHGIIVYTIKVCGQSVLVEDEDETTDSTN